MSNTKKRSTISQSGQTNKSLVWNAGTGVNICVTEKLRLDLAYRYYNLGSFTGKVTINHSIEGSASKTFKLKSLKSNEFTVGLMYNF